MPAAAPPIPAPTASVASVRIDGDFSLSAGDAARSCAPVSVRSLDGAMGEAFFDGDSYAVSLNDVSASACFDGVRVPTLDSICSGGDCRGVVVLVDGAGAVGVMGIVADAASGATSDVAAGVRAGTEGLVLSVEEPSEKFLTGTAAGVASTAVVGASTTSVRNSVSCAGVVRGCAPATAVRKSFVLTCGEAAAASARASSASASASRRASDSAASAGTSAGRVSGSRGSGVSATASWLVAAGRSSDSGAVGSGVLSVTTSATSAVLWGISGGALTAPTSGAGALPLSSEDTCGTEVSDTSVSVAVGFDFDRGKPASGRDVGNACSPDMSAAPSAASTVSSVVTTVVVSTTTISVASVVASVVASIVASVATAVGASGSLALSSAALACWPLAWRLPGYSIEKPALASAPRPPNRPALAASS